MMKTIGITLSILLAFPSLVNAQKETDADIILEKQDSEFHVRKDGSFEMFDTITYAANNNQGRQKLALREIPYIPESSRVRIIYAKTLNGETVNDIDLRTIQNKEVTSELPGLTNVRKIIIPFTHLSENSKVTYKYSLKQNNKNMAGLFSMSFVYGLETPEAQSDVRIISDVPLFYRIEDQDSYLETSYKEENKKFILTIRLRRTVAFVPKKEEYAPIIASAKVPRIMVTTSESWEKFASSMTAKYEKALTAPLPPFFKEISKKAQKEADELKKAHVIVAELAEKITYSGNWLTLDKMMYPRGHKEVVKSRTGDCKDYATSTVAILRDLGITAHVALVNRINMNSPNYLLVRNPIGKNSLLPSPHYFNHAIVKMTAKDGRVIWLDPTNPVSQSEAPFGDIADSIALTLAPATKDLERLPGEDSKANRTVIEKNFTPRLDETAEFQANVHAVGNSSAQIRIYGVEKGKEFIDKILWTLLSVQPDKDRMTIEKYDYKKRSYEPFKVSMKANIASPVVEDKEKNYHIMLPLPLGLSIYNRLSLDRKSALYIGSLGEDRVISNIKGVDVEDEINGDCTIYSSWIDFKRRTYKTSEGLRIEDTLITKKNFLLPEDLKSDRIRHFAYDLDKCAGTQMIKTTWFDSNKKDLVRKSIEDTANIDDAVALVEWRTSNSYKSAKKALRIFEFLTSKNPEDAKALAWMSRAIRDLGYLTGKNYQIGNLEEALRTADFALSKNPTLAVGHREKSRILMNMGNLPEAKKSFAKAFSFEPKASPTFILGGDLMEADKNFSASQKSFLKALELAQIPYEKHFANTRLAHWELNYGDRYKSIQYLKDALVIEPNDAWAWNTLGLSQMKLAEWDNAIASLEKASALGVEDIANYNLGLAYGGKARDSIAKNKVSDSEFKAAEKLAMKAVKLNPSGTDALAVLGSIYLVYATQDGPKESLDRSIEYLEKAIASGQTQDWVRGKLNQALALKAQRLPASK
ncbi:DUF3857 domain-containing protein [Bdellovibrio bacteriovorus]|uniref:DUF3857 domain-containing protein n=1 Tax=Bdellovibrio bacteriovorus TaxID=959 RepID=UPI0035A97E35